VMEIMKKKISKEIKELKSSKERKKI